ncbi:MAG: type II toxin-antitoxin system prevent-host-death family antitoxin [Gammaproteobacteria bacterium]|nr:type II toxin-antitoxin system prevent-host-death family antitoxin [Gammaproteobacteria bacterium]
METSIGAAKFKEQCLALLDRLPPEGIIITKHGKKLARLIPYREGNGELIDSLRGKIRISGDIMSTRVDWDAAESQFR